MEDDIENIKEFLKKSKVCIEKGIKEGFFDDKLFDNGPDIKKVWNEVENSINKSITSLNLNTWEALKEKGLTGDQFKFKTHGFDELVKKFTDLIKDKKDAAKKLLPYILKFINNILDSLGCLQPGFEVFKEFKNMCELRLEMRADKNLQQLVEGNE